MLGKLGFNKSGEYIRSNLSLQTINAMGAGQSLIDNMDQLAFLASAGAGSTYFESAVGNSALTKTVGDQIIEGFWVDDSGALADGTLLTNYLATVDLNYATRSDVNVVIWQQWNASRSLVTSDGFGAGEITPAEYESSLDYLISRFRAEHGADVKIILGLPHRRTSGNAQEDYGCQQMREIYLSKIDGDINISGVEHCDIDLIDTTHHTVAGATEFGTRFGDMANFAVNSKSKPDYPVLQTAVIDAYYITCTFSSNITLPISGFGQIKVIENNIEMTIDSIAFGASNELVITMIDGLIEANNPMVHIGYGVNAGLANTNADTLNNGAGTLPARGSVQAVTGVFPNLVYDGAVITALASVKEYSTALEGNLKGSGFEVHPNVANVDAPLDTALFSGRGGWKQAVGRNSCLELIDDHTAGSTLTYFLVIETPATFSGTTIGGIGVKDASTASRAYMYGSGANISYARNQANGFPALFAGATGGKHVICLRYNSAGSMDYFIDSVTSTGNFDPRDDFSVFDNIHLFSQAGFANGITDLAVGAFVLGVSAFSVSDITTIMNELGSEFGITIS